MNLKDKKLGYLLFLIGCYMLGRMTAWWMSEEEKIIVNEAIISFAHLTFSVISNAALPIFVSVCVLIMFRITWNLLQHSRFL